MEVTGITGKIYSLNWRAGETGWNQMRTTVVARPHRPQLRYAGNQEPIHVGGFVHGSPPFPLWLGRLTRMTKTPASSCRGREFRERSKTAARNGVAAGSRCFEGIPTPPV